MNRKLKLILKTLVIKSFAVLMIIGMTDSAAFSQTRIRFARGRNSATVSGSLSAGGERSYILGASEGQTMTIRLSASNDDVWVDIGGNDVGTARAASLTVTGKPGTLQVRLTDPQTQNKRPGMGGCTGDSGAPMFEDQNGRSIVAGVVSWSTGPNFTNGCGGITGVTPLTLYRDWVVQTARSWGAPL